MARTVFHVATRSFHIEKFQVILNWVEENLTREDVNKLFFVTNNEGETVFRVAAMFYLKEIFHGILNFVKENLREEVNKLF